MNKGTILVVDDALESLRLAGEILGAEGYRVLPANSGELALAAIAVNRPDLMLLDLRMPGMDGLEVLRRLKADEAMASLPVMMLSGVTEGEQRLEALRLGAVDFITKPFQREELIARVKSHVALSLAYGLLQRRVEDLRWTNNQLEDEMAQRQRVEDELKAANDAARIRMQEEMSAAARLAREGERTELQRKLREQLDQPLADLRRELAEIRHKSPVDLAPITTELSVLATRLGEIDDILRRFIETP